MSNAAYSGDQLTLYQWQLISARFGAVTRTVIFVKCSDQAGRSYLRVTAPNLAEISCH